MATCPKCFGALNEHHKCPRGIFHRISDALMTAMVGGLVGWMFCLAIEERPAGAVILAAAALRRRARVRRPPGYQRPQPLGAVAPHDLQQHRTIDRFRYGGDSAERLRALRRRSRLTSPPRARSRRSDPRAAHGGIRCRRAAASSDRAGPGRAPPARDGAPFGANEAPRGHPPPRRRGSPRSRGGSPAFPGSRRRLRR